MNASETTQNGAAARARLTVYLVDDDAAIRDAISLSLSLRGYQTAQFADAESFFNAYDSHWSGCVVADIRMPGMNGLQMQTELATRGSRLPVVIITGHGDVAAARTAFRNRAVDFLEKPFDDDQLINAIETAFSHEMGRINSEASSSRRTEVLASLSPREHDVLRLVIRGLHAREIGEQLGISHRTVEVHKAHIMEKMGARSVVEVVRLAEGLMDLDSTH